MLKKIILIFILSLYYVLPGNAQAVHKPAELLKIMKDSKVTYVVAELYVDVNPRDYSNMYLNGTNIYHEDSDGHMAVKKLVLMKDAEAEWNAGEKSFTQDSNLIQARKHYKNVLDMQSDYYPAKVRIGQTFEKEKDFEKATMAYKQAVSKNFVDYMPHWMLAEAYYKEKNFEDAASEITLAHILDRNNSKIIERLIDMYADAKLNYDDWVFTPQVKLFKGQKENEIKVLSKEGWGGYAIGKAIWGYEPGYSESQGEKPGALSLLQEQECLLTLLAGYDETKIKTPDAGLVNLQKAQENKLLEGFIYYEIFLKQQPAMVYQLPNTVIKKMKNYFMLTHSGQKS
jgi:tetratricopeptide (TPR) repeat protein